MSALAEDAVARLRRDWEPRFRRFVAELPDADPAHGPIHLERVVATATRLAAEEGARLDIVLPAAWLHDCVHIAKDSPERARASQLAADHALRFLGGAGYPPACLPEIRHAIEAHSFSAGIAPRTIEAKVVQDADRLDALGAIGLARCLAVGTALGRPLYAPADPFCRTRAPDGGGASVDHFYTKPAEARGHDADCGRAPRSRPSDRVSPGFPRAARIGGRAVSRGVSARDALLKLREGNARFAAHARGTGTLLTAARRAKLTAAQEPFAIILGCSDSRVPVELVFNQGPGDLFVIRVAGNIVAPSLIGSVEFAADRFGTRLVVVLGHSSCGAIAATIEELHRPAKNPSPNQRAIVDRIRPGVIELVERHEAEGALAVEHAAMTANVRASVNQLLHGSSIIENLIANDGLVVTGAWYSLETGKVEFLDDARPA